MSWNSEKGSIISVMSELQNPCVCVCIYTYRYSIPWVWNSYSIPEPTSSARPTHPRATPDATNLVQGDAHHLARFSRPFFSSAPTTRAGWRAAAHHLALASPAFFFQARIGVLVWPSVLSCLRKKGTSQGIGHLFSPICMHGNVIHTRNHKTNL